MTQFAGFDYPKTTWFVHANLSQRLKEFKQNGNIRVCGPYYKNEPGINPTGTMFYLESDFMPELRWQWCDEASQRIRHTGWFTDEYGDEKIRGIVLRLNHERGFIAGWSMGKGMASEIEYDIYDDEIDAAMAADRLAEIAAEHQREYEASERAKEEQD